MKVYILVPSFKMVGPVKGAIALANSLSLHLNVTLVSVKGGSIPDVSLKGKVQVLSLENYVSFYEKIKNFRSILKTNSEKPIVISLCFSADALSFLSSDLSHTISSVRSNLFSNYRMDYGFLGLALALFHLFLLKKFDFVTVMTKAMADHVYSFSRRELEIIGNFIDEEELESFVETKEKNNYSKLVFVGSLTKRKQPELVVKLLKSLCDKNIDVCLDIVGDGPLRKHLIQMVERMQLSTKVVFHGQVDRPYEIISKADLMIMPSLSEGISRAVLEALHLRVPVVIRNVDGNSELINNYHNGMLFDEDNKLVDSVIQALDWARELNSKESLLPTKFRQEYATNQYLDLIKQLKLAS